MSSSPELLSPDEALARTNGFSRYQILSLLTGTLCLWGDALYIFSIPFFMATPTILCRSSSGGWDICDYTADYICDHNIEYSYQEKTQNFVSEFDLLCDSSASGWLTAAIFIGSFPGFIVFGFFGDVWGRIPVILVSAISTLTFLCLMLVLPSNLYMVIVFTTFIGFATTGLAFSPFTLAFECVKDNHVTYVGVFLNVMYATTQIIVAMLSLGELRWRIHCMVVVFITLCLFIPLPFLKDPPKYYISKRNEEKALASFVQVAKINGTVWEPDWKLALPESCDFQGDSASVKAGVTELFVNKVYRWRLMLNTVLLMGCGMIYYAITMNMPNIDGDTTLNAVLNSGAEIVAYVASGYMLSKLGYFATIYGGIAVAGTAILLMSLLTRMGTGSSFVNVLMYIAKFADSMSYGITVISSDTVFPPKVRNTAVSLAFAICAIGEALVCYLVGGGFKLGLDVCNFFASVATMLAAFALHSGCVASAPK